METNNLKTSGKGRILIKYVLLPMTYTGLVICLFRMFLIQYEKTCALTIIEKEALNFVEILEEDLAVRLNFVDKDIKYMRQLLEQAITSEENDLKILAGSYSTFSEVMKRYEQIRFIDKKGMEKVRVNYSIEVAEVVPDYGLQDKSKRYYVTETLKLNKNEIYISPFDLNIENGNIEIPLKPVLRIGIPVFDKSYRKQGIIVINYLGRELLDQFKKYKTKTHGIFLLVNPQGYFLVGPAPEMEWGFMFEDRKDITFQKFYPAEWERITSQDDGQFSTENGLFTFESYYPVQEREHTFSTGREDVEFIGNPDSIRWKVISLVEPEELEKIQKEYGEQFSLLLSLTVLFFLAVTILIVRIVIKRKQPPSP